MNLISPQLLFGLAFAAIPVLLHLLMKSKPKKVLFPALRLIQMRKKTNSRRMRLKHIWLLLLRTLLLIGIVIAVARPSLPAANYGLSWTELGTLAGILAVAAGVYYWFKRRWNQQRTAPHDLRYKTTVLRGGTGTAIAVLILLLVGLPYGNRIAAELSGDTASTMAQDVPVAAVFVFDNSLSMEYRLENKTRLEAAREIATAHLGTLPPGSRVAIADIAANRDIVFQGDLISAGARIDALKSEPGTVEINDRLSMAIDAQADDRKRLQQERSLSEDDDQYVREIYVLTDMARTAWRTGTTNLRQKLEDKPWVHTYLIDVSVEEPINCAITDVRLSRQSLTRGSAMDLDATLLSDGIDGLRTVEVFVNDKLGEPVRQGTRTIKMEPGVGGRVQFPIVAPAGRYIQGEVRLVSSDPLAIDDIRYFTVGVNSPPRVLVIGENLDETDNLLTALAPDLLKKQNRAKHVETYRSVRKVTEDDIRSNEIVCLVNLRGPSPELWEMLQRFVESGGGLAVFLGNSDIDATAYNTPEAQQLLPAELLAPVRFFKGPFIVDLKNDQHPLFRRTLDSNDERAEFASVFY